MPKYWPEEPEVAVSLEGTLETIALPDVLALLSVTAKTGELRVESGGSAGSVWFDAGRVAGFEVGSHNTVVDALFSLLRLREGSFKFHTGTEPAHAIEPEDVVPVLEEAENRLNEWPAIAAAVPSLRSEAHLIGTVEGSVMLRPEQWRLVTTIAGGRSVGDVLAERGLGEFDGCKALKELVDLKLVWVNTAAPEPVTLPTFDLASPATEAPDHTADLSGPTDDVSAWAEDGGAVADVADLSDGWGSPYPGNGHEPVEEPVLMTAEEGASDQVVTDERADDGTRTENEQPAAPVAEPVNRGLLLKFLGSARN
jgi:Domain of unknown function (DUF4388)